MILMINNLKILPKEV